MKNIWVITVYTLREAMARKVFIFFTAISILVLLLMALIFGMSDSVSIHEQKDQAMLQWEILLTGWNF